MYSCLAKYYDALMKDVDYDSWLALVIDFIKGGEVRCGEKTNDVSATNSNNYVSNYVSASGKIADYETINAEITNGANNSRAKGKAIANNLNSDKSYAGLKKGADLACGTGTFTVNLAKAGYNVFGVDNSPQMLEYALIKAKRAGLSINFVCQDINRFLPPSKLDFVTCMCDGVNYLKNPAKLFKSVSNSLNPNGIFIFDISTEYKLTNVLANNTFTSDENGVVYIWQNSLKKDRVDINLTFFEKSGDTYIRFDESQTMYIHKKDTLLDFLKQDFDVKIYAESAAKPPKASENRIHFVATKK